MVTVMSLLALVLVASRCSDDEDEGSAPSAAEPVSESDPDPSAESAPAPDEGGDEVLGEDAVEPDPGLGEGGIELDGPIAPQEGDGSTPDEPSFEPSEPVEPEAED
jgi:hypothetical protein